MFRNSLDMASFQNRRINLDILKQEIIHNDDFDQRHLSPASTSTTLSTMNILDTLRNSNHSRFKMPTYSPNITSSNLLNADKATSIIPLETLLDGLCSMLERIFGKEIWIYSFLTLFISCVLIFILCICACTYCFCCTKCGRNYICCFKFPKLCPKRI